MINKIFFSSILYVSWILLCSLQFQCIFKWWFATRTSCAGLETDIYWYKWNIRIIFYIANSRISVYFPNDNTPAQFLKFLCHSEPWSWESRAGLQECQSTSFCFCNVDLCVAALKWTLLLCSDTKRGFAQGFQLHNLVLQVTPAVQGRRKKNAFVNFQHKFPQPCLQSIVCWCDSPGPGAVQSQ